MKRIIVYCVALLCAAPVAASTICAEDDVIAVVLDPTISGLSYSTNADLMEWTTTLPYGSVWGVAACLGVSGGGTGQIGPENLADSNGMPVVGGERTGNYCWCQMRHPARSRWVFYSNLPSCTSMCVGYCGGNGNAATTSTMRNGLFGAVGN